MANTPWTVPSSKTIVPRIATINRHFSIENHRFQGQFSTISAIFSIENSKTFWHLCCNSQYSSRSLPGYRCQPSRNHHCVIQNSSFLIQKSSFFANKCVDFAPAYVSLIRVCSLTCKAAYGTNASFLVQDSSFLVQNSSFLVQNTCQCTIRGRGDHIPSSQ